MKTELPPVTFRVYFINFNYSSGTEPETLEEAKEIARKAGFESQIYECTKYGDEICFTYSPISGFREVRRCEPEYHSGSPFRFDPTIDHVEE